MDLPPAKVSQLIVNKLVTEFSGVAVQGLREYLDEVLAWSDRLGLVSRKDPVAACERLLLESLELDRILSLAGPLRIADVGSGAGFPGVVWALQHPDASVVLIERREKKSAFLERVCRTLSLRNAAAFGGDARESTAPGSFRSAFDLVVTMAVGDPARTAPRLEWLLAERARFATTVSRDAEPPPRVGRRLELAESVAGKFGRYAIYRNGV
jgi:16S rRNA (guanine(527)-N(7))-methyltransferase RsmG